MHFEITHGVKAGKQLTAAQRNSSLFSEEPRIGAQTLRRGSPPMKLDRERMVSLASQLKRLFLAGSIEIAGVDGDRKMDLRSDLVKMATGRGLTLSAVVDEVFADISRSDPGLRRAPPPEDNDPPQNDPPPPAADTRTEEQVAADAEVIANQPRVEETPVVQPEALADTVAPATTTATTEPVSEKKKGRKQEH